MLSHLSLFRTQLRHYNSEKTLQDHYATLNVPQTATREEIRNAFIEAAKKVHPDKLVNLDEIQKGIANSRFKKLNEAYEVLGDVSKRKKYDNERGIRTPRTIRTNPHSGANRGIQFGFISKRKKILTIINITVITLFVGISTLVRPKPVRPVRPTETGSTEE